MFKEGSLSGILLHFLNRSLCPPLTFLSFFTLCPSHQFHHQNSNLFICCLLCLINVWGHFGSVPGDIWLPDSELPENPLPCWIYLLLWDPPLGVLLETCLARVGKLHPVFLARSRRRVAEDNSKCVPGSVPGGPFPGHLVMGWLWGDEHKAGGSWVSSLRLHHSLTFTYQEFNNLCMIGFH